MASSLSSSLRPPPSVSDLLSLLTEKMCDPPKLLRALLRTKWQELTASLRSLFKTDVEEAVKLTTQLLRLLCPEVVHVDLDEVGRVQLLKRVTSTLLDVIVAFEATCSDVDGSKKLMVTLNETLCVHMDAFPQSVLLDLLVKAKQLLVEEKGSRVAKLGKLFFEALTKMLDVIVLHEKIDPKVDNLNEDSDNEHSIMDVVSELTEEPMSGSLYRSKWLQVVCSERWDVNIVLPLLSLSRDLNLNSSDVDQLVRKATSMIAKLECQAVPALTHQVLMLTRSNGNGHISMAAVIIELDRYFDQALINEHGLNKNSAGKSGPKRKKGSSSSTTSSTMIEARSTVIHHLSEAVKLSHPLHSDLLKLLRSAQQAPDLLLLRPFKLLLLLSSIWRHNKRTFVEGLRLVIAKSLQLAEPRSSSVWYRCVHTRKIGVDAISDLFKNMIEETSGNQGSKFGAFYLIEEGIVALATTLLDYGDVKEKVTKIDKIAKQCHAIGASLLVEVVSSNLATRRGSLALIMKTLTTQIVQSKGGPQYTDALRMLAKTATADLYENSQLLEDLVDQLSNLSVIGARRTLSALLPLLKLGSVANSVVLVLRKALFARDSAIKIIGINGVLRLLKALKIKSMLPTTQLSQGSSLSVAVEDIHRGRGPSHECLCSELLGVLRRGLSQHMNVRLTIYRELPEVVTRNPELCEGVFDLVFQHGVDSKWIVLRKKNEETTNDVSLIDVDRLVNAEESSSGNINEGAHISDPVGWYLLCVNELLVLSKRLYPSHELDDGVINSDDDDDYYDDKASSLKEFFSRRQKLQAFLSTLAHKYSTLDLMDLSIEKCSDYSVIGSRNNAKLSINCSIYEALMEHVVCNGATETIGKADVFQSLSKVHHDLRELTKVGGSKKAMNNVAKKADDSQCESQAANTTMNRKQRMNKSKRDARSTIGNKTIGGGIVTQHCLSFRTVVGLLQVLLEMRNSGTEEERGNYGDSVLSSLRSNTSLVSYLLEVLLDKLLEMDLVLTADTQDSCSRDLLMKQLKTTSKIFTNLCLMAHFRNSSTTVVVPPTALHQGTKVLSMAVQIFINHYENERNDFFPFILDLEIDNGDKDEVNAIHGLVEILFSWVEKLYSDHCGEGDDNSTRSDDQQAMKSVGDLLQLARFLLIFVTSNYPESILVHNKVEDWVRRIGDWRLCQHKSILPPYLGLFLDVALAKKGDRSLLLDLCCAIHIGVGDIDESLAPQEDASSPFAFVTASTSETIFKHVNKVVEHNLNLIELSTSRAKQLVLSSECKLALVTDDIDQIGEELCIYTATLAKPLIELTQSKLSLNLLIDVLLKNISKVYSICSAITKFFTLRLKSSKYCLQTSAFSKFVKLIGSKLTAFTYKLISHIEQIMELDAKMDNPVPGSGKVAKTRIQKEARVIPNVIYRIEQFENDVIKLSRKSKIDFMQNVKRPVARDFKLDVKELNKMIQNQDTEEDEPRRQEEQRNQDIVNANSEQEEDERNYGNADNDGDDGNDGSDDDDKANADDIFSPPVTGEHDAESTRVDHQHKRRRPNNDDGNELDDDFGTQASSIVAGNVAANHNWQCPRSPLLKIAHPCELCPGKGASSLLFKYSKLNI